MPFPSGQLFVLVIGLTASVAGAQVSVSNNLAAPDISYQNELQHSIDRGLAWLQSNQHCNGWWSVADYPAVTVLDRPAK